MYRDLTKSVQFDWHSYFEDFDLAHGGEPVTRGGTRLLYRDGWEYSLNNLAGPEWAPTKETIHKLKITYWQTREDLVTQELALLKQQIKMLGDFQQLKDQLLKVFTYEYNEDSGTTKRVTINLNLSHIEARISWLKEDLTDCNSELNSLNNVANRRLS